MASWPSLRDCSLTHFLALAAAACCCYVLLQRLWLWHAWRHRLPRLPGDKLTRDLLQRALQHPSPLVRLPGRHGVLVTDPALARKLLEGAHGVIRDIQDYERYAGFLSQSLVLLPPSVHHATLRACLLPLFAPKRAHATLLACIGRLLDRLEEHAVAGRAVPLYKELQLFVLDTTRRATSARPPRYLRATSRWIYPRSSPGASTPLLSRLSLRRGCCSSAPARSQSRCCCGCVGADVRDSRRTQIPEHALEV